MPSSCKWLRSGKLGCNEWWVVGGIYSPNHQTSRLVGLTVVWCTGQSGAHRTLSGARFPSINGAVDRWQPESRWRTGHVRCTPDSPVPPSSRWLGHVSRADRAADRWPGRPLAHRTVRCTPDSPVNFSRSRRRKNPRAAGLRCADLAHRTLSGAHRTVRCSQTRGPSVATLLLC